MLPRLSTAAVLTASMLCAAGAQAGPLTASEVLTQFNTVVLGSATSSSHTDGRTYVGGSLSGGDYVQHVSDTAKSNYAGVTVRGAVDNVKVNGLGLVAATVSNSIVNSGTAVASTSSNTKFNNAAYVDSSSGTTFNGGKLDKPSEQMQTNIAAASSTDMGAVLGGLSDSLKTLKSTGSSVKFSGNLATFNAVANASGLAVFDLTAIDTDLFKMGEFRFNLNGATSVILNTDVKTANISANFLDGGAQAFGKMLLWNFYDATSLTINNQWGGSLLATDAAFTNNQNMEGGVYVNSLTQRGEIHLQSFSGKLPGKVPEPGSVAMMLTGLALMGAISRRRRAAPKN